MAVTPPSDVRPGDVGSAVLDVQARLVALGYPIDERGRFGPHTESAVKVFQIRRGLSPDGNVDHETWRELVEAGWTLGRRTLYLRRPPMRGDDIRELQRQLNALGFDAGKDDGIFDEQTQEAVRDFQRNFGLPADGYAGHETFDALERLQRRIGPGSKAELKQRLTRDLATGLAGHAVYLDPGHGGTDAGFLTPFGIPEAYVVYRVAELAAAHIALAGGYPLLSRAMQQGPDIERRCDVANRASSDLAVSFHLGCRPEPGPTVTFWSADRAQSKMGRALAEAIGERLRPRLHRVQILGRNLPFLRQTQMPAVAIDLSSEDNEPLLAEDPYIASLGKAITRGIEDYFTAAA